MDALGQPTHRGACVFPPQSVWLCWAFVFPGSSSRYHWRGALHCLQKGKVLRWGREEISWQENTHPGFLQRGCLCGRKAEPCQARHPTPGSCFAFSLGAAIFSFASVAAKLSARVKSRGRERGDFRWVRVLPCLNSYPGQVLYLSSLYMSA